MTEKRYRSARGVEIFTYPNAAQHGFYIALYVRAGAASEPEGQEGITHFLEHVVMRDVASRAGGTLYATLDRLGLDFNAATYRDMVQFYISGPRERLGEGAALLCRILSPLTLCAADVDAERRRVRAEVREAEDRTSLSSVASSVVYAGTPARYSILGTSRSLGRITRRTLEDYRRRVMCAENIFFYMTGAVDEGDVQTLAAIVDGYELPRGERAPTAIGMPEGFLRRDASVIVRSGDYTAVRLSFDVPTGEVAAPVLDLLYDTLFTGYNARFFTELSERRGLCYDVTGGIDRYPDVGHMSVTFELSSRDVYEAVEAAVELLREAKRQPAPDADLPRAMYDDCAGLLYDDAAELNFTMANDAHIQGLPYRSLDDRRAAYRAVTGEELMLAARCIFRPERAVLLVKGPRGRIDRERLRATLLRL